MRFKSLQIGDKVIIVYGLKNERRIAEVTHITATQFVADGIRFMRNCGSEFGTVGQYSGKTAQPATPDLIASVQAEMHYRSALNGLRNQLAAIDTAWRKIDRQHDCINHPDRISQAIPHLMAAAEVLKDTPTPPTTPPAGQEGE